MPDLAFEYFEVRPCIDLNGAFVSYLSEAAFDEDRQRLDAKGTVYKISWTLYGRHTDINGICAATAIGDFKTKDDAFQIMNAILAPMAAARDFLDIGGPHWQGRLGLSDQMAKASNILSDFIAQSSDRKQV